MAINVLSAGQKNLLDFLTVNITGLNIVLQYQTVPKQATYPTLVVTNISEELKGYMQVDVRQNLPPTSTVNEVIWGEEFMKIAVEVIHNNRLARDSLMSTIRSLFIRRGVVLHGGSTITIDSYKNLETPKEVQLNNWFSVLHFSTITPITFEEQVSRMDTIQLDFSNNPPTYTDETQITN